ncbi:MAG: DUF2267 domain-containing protein [Halobacteriota archaeon]
MNYKTFVGQVHHRLELATFGQAVRAIRATLTTLGERLEEGEATDLASPLPMEIDRYLATADSGQRFSYDEFLDRVAKRQQSDRGDANYYAQQIVGLVSEIVPPGNVEKARNQLPEDFEPLFEFVQQPPDTPHREPGDE